MHRTRTLVGRVTLPLVAAGILLACLPAAQATEAFKMGVVDPQAVLEKSKAGKKALDGLKEYVSTRQKLLSGDEEDLRNTEKTLKEQAAKFSDTEKKKKRHNSVPKCRSFRNARRSLIRNYRASRKSWSMNI